MTAQEVYNHDWKEGEIIYGILHKYSGDLKMAPVYKGTFTSGTKSVRGEMAKFPIEVVPLKVKKIEHTKYESFGDEFLFIDFEEDKSKKAVHGDYQAYISIHKDKNGKVTKVVPNFDKSHLECKFFTKEEAVAVIRKINLNIIKQYKTSIKHFESSINELEGYIKSYERYINEMQNSIDKIS